MTDSRVTKPGNVDTVFSWESQQDCEPNKCRMRLYWITWEKALVIATDLTDNAGRKIANVSQEIISFTSHIYDIAPCKIMLVEHYLIGDSPSENIYLQVLLMNQEAVRYEIDRNRLIELTGISIEG